MNLNETLELIRAGFTRDEILAMQAAAPTPAPAPAPEPAPVPSPALAPEPAPAPAVPAPEPAPTPAPAPAPYPAPAAEPKKELSDVERIIASLGDLAKGIDVPPHNNLTIEEKLGNTILAAMGIKPKEEK